MISFTGNLAEFSVSTLNPWWSSVSERLDNLAPRAGVEDSPLRSPRTGEPFGVPALILPDERDLLEVP
jgi:hypothetical protein